MTKKKNASDKAKTSSRRPAGGEARAAEGDRRLAAQRALISGLERNGQSATDARSDLEALQFRQKRRRARLQDEADTIDDLPHKK